VVEAAYWIVLYFLLVQLFNKVRKIDSFFLNNTDKILLKNKNSSKSTRATISKKADKLDYSNTITKILGVTINPSF